MNTSKLYYDFTLSQHKFVWRKQEIYVIYLVEYIFIIKNGEFIRL